METRINNIECEMKYILDEGYDPSKAAETCASAEGRRFDEETGRSPEDESWDE
jgi:hypothetical protein